MIPVDFKERLAALVPRPLLHLIRLHGGPRAERETARPGRPARARIRALRTQILHHVLGHDRVSRRLQSFGYAGD